MLNVLVSKFDLGAVAEEFRLPIRVDPPIDDGIHPDEIRKAWVELLLSGGAGKIRLESYFKMTDAVIPPNFLPKE
jgi:hypothetical protein